MKVRKKSSKKLEKKKVETRVSTLPAHRKAPIQQPGGDDLTSITKIIFKWTRGEIHSSIAILHIKKIVNDSEYFDMRKV
jgi:hypothetical protein